MVFTFGKSLAPQKINLEIHAGCSLRGIFFMDIFYCGRDGSNEVSHAHGQGWKVRFALHPIRRIGRQTGRIDIITKIYRYFKT